MVSPKATLAINFLHMEKLEIFKQILPFKIILPFESFYKRKNGDTEREKKHRDTQR